MTKHKSQPNIRITKAKPVDCDAISELLFELKTMYASCHETDIQNFKLHYNDAIKKSIISPTNMIWVARISDGEIIGFISITYRLVLRLGGKVGTLEEIFVKSKWRCCGVGIQLWQYAEEELRNRGIKTVEIVSSLAHPGQRPFSEKVGYKWYSNIHRVQL